jgi:hypothetical protein
MNTTNNTTWISRPEELWPLLVESHVCEYASLKKDGTPVTTPLTPFPGEQGRTIDINTGLSYPWKAERARKHPKVCLLYSDSTCRIHGRPATALVYGQATVRDADLQANTDRYIRAVKARWSMFRKLPRPALRWMVGYLARIWILITPLKVLWWPKGEMDASPRVWCAPAGIQVPPSDPRPERGRKRYSPLSSPAADWSQEIHTCFERLGSPILTVVDQEGYPVPFRVSATPLDSLAIHLKIPAVMPAEARGRACLTFHTLQTKGGEMVANENYAFIGSVSGEGDAARFKIERRLPSISFRRSLGDMISLGLAMNRMRSRLEHEAARRGQPVPVINLE